MKTKWFYIQLLVLLGLTVFLMSFASQRNGARKTSDAVIRFDDESTPFITRKTVNKLLKQKDTTATGSSKEKLDLQVMESRVKSHPIVKTADVYVTPSGAIGVKVLQKTPLVRISESPSFYLDTFGEQMPLSENYAARVPIATGISEQQLPEVHQLISFINQDAFLTEHITGLRYQKGDYELYTRNQKYTIVLGTVSALQAKFNNYAAFYKKATKDSVLKAYKKVHLEYQNQVVGQRK